MSALDLAETGPAGAGVVVLLHGWPAGPSTWRRLVPLLATRFRVLVPELRDPDLGAQARAVEELLASRGVERYAAVGHGHGGGVAQLLAAGPRPPAALVLLDTIAFEEAPPTDLDVRAFVERGSVEFADLTEDDLDGYTGFGAPPPAPFDLTPAATKLAEGTAPVLLLWGEDDPYLPMGVAERLSDELPGSTLGMIPDSGHFLLDDAFDPAGVMIHEYLRVRYEGAPHGHEGVVMLQLERRPPWVDGVLPDDDGDEPAPPTGEQEVGRHA